MRDASSSALRLGGNVNTNVAAATARLSTITAGVPEPEGEGRRRLLSSIGVPVGPAVSGPSGDAGTSSNDGGLEVRELVQNALRALDGSG